MYNFLKFNFSNKIIFYKYKYMYKVISQYLNTFWYRILNKKIEIIIFLIIIYNIYIIYI